MLVGSYNHKIDSKGRTVLPAKFRGELGPYRAGKSFSKS